MPDQTSTGQWSCKSCGATFPSIRFDDDVDRCSQCVIVEVQGQRIAELQARAAFIDSGPSPIELDGRGGHFCAAMQELTERRAFEKDEIAQLLGEHKQQIADLRAELERELSAARAEVLEAHRHPKSSDPEQRWYLLHPETEIVCTRANGSHVADERATAAREAIEDIAVLLRRKGQFAAAAIVRNHAKGGS